MWRESSGTAPVEALRDQKATLSRKLRVYLGLGPQQKDEIRQIAALLRGWTDLVMHIEEGYDLGGEDYTNDLDARTLLEKSLEEVPAAGARLQEVIEAWDDRFKRTTVVRKEPAGGLSHLYRSGLPRLATLDVPWWYFRYPRCGNLE